jgi:hypothetical protein
MLTCRRCAAPEHDEQTPKVCADVDEETVKYGYKDPSLDLMMMMSFICSFFDNHIFTSGTRQGIILVGTIGLRTQKNAQMLVLILFWNACSTDGWASRKPLTESPNLVTNNWICYIDQFDINLRFRDSLNGYMLIGLRHKTQYRKLSLF